MKWEQTTNICCHANNVWSQILVSPLLSIILILYPYPPKKNPYTLHKNISTKPHINRYKKEHFNFTLIGKNTSEIQSNYYYLYAPFTQIGLKSEHFDSNFICFDFEKFTAFTQWFCFFFKKKKKNYQIAVPYVCNNCCVNKKNQASSHYMITTNLGINFFSLFFLVIY